MKPHLAAAWVLASAAPLFRPLYAQPVATPTPDFTYAVPIAGTWTFAPTADGSEATFRTATSTPQLTVRCSRTTRRVSIAKPGNRAVPFLALWTDSMARSVPASFDPATARVTILLATTDPLLDALAFGRGRIAIQGSGQPALVVPAWPEIARVIEDCRN